MNKVLRKVTKNMKSYPGSLLMMDKEDGGLGLTGLSDLAQDRKLKLMIKCIDNNDATGFALRGMVGRGHRLAGEGGLEDTEMIMGDTLGDNTWITSLVQWLSEMNLGLRSNGKKEKPIMATTNAGKKERIEMNKRGMVTRSETEEGEEGEKVRIRVGQCWKREGNYRNSWIRA